MRLATPGLAALLFDDEGRIPRRLFWLYLVAAAAFVIALLLGLPLFGVPARIAPVAASLLLIYPSYCVIAKRLQDVGVDGRWAILMSGVAAVDALVAAAGSGGAMPYLRALWWWVALANGLAFLGLGLVPGARGPNAYGPQRL